MNRFRPVVSRRVPSGTHFAELYLTPGPQEIGVTGDNSYEALYGSEWLFMIEDDTRLLRAYQKVDSVWVERTTDPRMPPIVGQEMDASVRRLSGTFDQSARAVIAYEVGEGVVTGTRWDPTLGEYKQNIDFLGTDPQVVIDAWWSGDIPQSDVLVFYLSPDRQRMCCRLQRDLYAVEHELWAFDAPVILDRVVAAPLRYQLLLSDASGVPLPEVLVSDLYAFRGREGAGATASSAPGAYVMAAVRREHREASSVTGYALGGAYTSPVVFAPATQEGATSIALALAGNYASAVVEEDAGREPSLVTGHALSGAFTQVALRVAPFEPEAATATAIAMNGAYSL